MGAKTTTDKVHCKPGLNRFRYAFLDGFRDHKPSKFVLLDQAIDLVGHNCFPNTYGKMEKTDFADYKYLIRPGFRFDAPDPSKMWRVVPGASPLLGHAGPRYNLLHPRDRTAFVLPPIKTLTLRKRAWSKIQIWIRRQMLSAHWVAADGEISELKAESAYNMLRRQTQLLQATGTFWISRTNVDPQLGLLALGHKLINGIPKFGEY